ncbi:NXPE family member 3-like isoform X2 [Syngnathus acus]|uniref:NXPE family member 3-like isoform X2 n=1 Tax=Syngnathus acus TaxID=161584 RepID=UPI001885AF55|nr:NXPE family member 3-like isoform X2 [Syngnathus acus]
MSLNDWKWIFIVLTLFGLIVLLRNIITEENWKYSVVSAALDEVQYGNQSSNLTRSLPAFYPNHSYCPHQGLPMSLEEQLEERNLLDSIIWPYPPSGSELLNLSQTSDPAHSLFTIVPSQKDQQWHVGDQLEVQIHLHDYEGRPKRYGGDFLLARLQSPHCRAGVVGQVLDHKNGVYSARLPLLWEGSTQVEVMMVHSSEAIAVLWRLREKRPDRVYFTGNFRRGRLSETTVCNMCFLLQDKGPRCNFTDLQTGEPWYCYTPKKLSCEDRISHAKGGYLKGIITSKEALLFQSGVNIKVRINAATTDTIDVLPSRTSEERKEDPVTSGYYYRDLWRPFRDLPMRPFNQASAITQCLTNKLVYLYGDSTMRQWYDYLISVLPELKEFAYKPKSVGPLMAVDSTRNILVHYRCHGPPIRFATLMASELRYIANELDGLTGGPDTVVAISIWSHFSTFPAEVYMRRLRLIRKAVVRLLNRSPATAVIVRTGNPQIQRNDISLYNSDWFSLQLNTVLRSMFEGLDVLLVDAWQMCVAHHEPHNLHPPRPIIKNMVDLMLSYVCRNGTTNTA